MGEFSCSDIFTGCPERVETATLEELLGQVTRHVQQRHGLDELSPELVARVLDALRPTR